MLIKKSDFSFQGAKGILVFSFNIIFKNISVPKSFVTYIEIKNGVNIDRIFLNF